MPYSRAFNHNTHTGDTLRRPSSNPPPVVCKTGFLIDNLKNWMENNIHNANLHYVAIRTITRQSDNQRIFKMESFDNNDVLLDALEGDLPCPNNCVPPEDSVAPIDNTFSKAHIMAVRAFDHISKFNVHSALRILDNLNQETHSIYAVTGDGAAAKEHTGPTDPIFTSIHHKA